MLFLYCIELCNRTYFLSLQKYHGIRAYQGYRLLTLSSAAPSSLSPLLSDDFVNSTHPPATTLCTHRPPAHLLRPPVNDDCTRNQLGLFYLHTELTVPYRNQLGIFCLLSKPTAFDPLRYFGTLTSLFFNFRRYF